MLVTGAAGYLGRQVVRLLGETGRPALALARSAHQLDDGLPPHVVGVACDLNDAGRLRQVLDRHRPSAVLHLAAHIPRSKEPAEDEKSRLGTLLATTSLLDACAAQGCVRHIAFSSSIAVYGAIPADGQAYREVDPPRPGEAYGRHKLDAEHAVTRWAKTHGGSAISLRFAGIHGPPRRSGMLFRFAEAARAGAALAVDDPESVFSVLFVQDAARACLAALDRPPAAGYAECYNIAGAETMRLREIASAVLAALGGGAMKPGDGRARTSAMSVEKAAQALGWRPEPFRCRLREAIAVWCGSH